MEQGDLRFALRIPRSAIVIQSALALWFVYEMTAGGRPTAQFLQGSFAAEHLHLALVIFGFFALVSWPWLMIKVLRAALVDPFVEIDPIQVTVAGHSFRGDPDVIAFRDIAQVEIKRFSGVEFLTIHGRDHTQINLRAPLFSDQEAYERFKRELMFRVEQAGRHGTAELR